MKKIHLLFYLFLINICIIQAQNTDNFITEWEGNSQISFFIEATGPVNYTWINSNNQTESGTIPAGTVYTTLHIAHSSSSKFILSIEPTHLKRFYMLNLDFINNHVNSKNLIDIKQWGTANWSSMANAFYECTKLTTISATDIPNLSNVTDMSAMFKRCTLLKTISNLSNWDTSNITNMSNLFSYARAFNQDINAWNTGNVTNMELMFEMADLFNSPLSNWNTSKVTTMQRMFFYAKAFNKNLNSWDTGNVTNMKGMFASAIVFNGELANWNTNKVANMSGMFSNAFEFNQPIENWNTANVTDMSTMFNTAAKFNADISKWNTEKVTNMYGMFNFAAKFNADISKWNTANVTNMGYMFNFAVKFNADISKWDIRNIELVDNMLDKSGMDCTNYSALLNSWASNPNTPNNIAFGASGRTYGTNVITDRDALLAKDWTITGDTAGSDVCNINLSATTFSKLQMQYYPNPVTDILNITHQDLIKKVEVYTVLGQKITEEVVNQKQVQINLAKQPKGLYLVKVYTATANGSFKVTKQ